jgi:O-antigen/teichoic acid export membrane protein
MDRQAIPSAMMLMGLAVPFACLQSYIESVARSFGWTVRALLPVYIFRHALLLLFILAAVGMGFEANAVNGFVCLVLALTSSLVWQALDIAFRVRRVVPPGPRAYRVQEWVRGSVPFAVLYGSMHLSSVADVLVLSFFLSPAEIAIYFAATRIIQVVNMVPFAATVGTAHLFSASHTRGDDAELQRLSRYVALMTFTVAALAVAAILATGPHLLRVFGSGFEAGYPALAILAVGVVARVSVGPAEDILNMTGHSALSARTYLVIVGVNLALALALVTPFGIAGAAVASAISLYLRALWLSASVRRRLGIQTSILSAMPSLQSPLGARRTRQHPVQIPAE